MTTTDNSRADALTDRDPSKTSAEQGLFRKFDVRRTDRTDLPGCKHDGCEYFVLDMNHDGYARAALRAYARACAAEFPVLAADLNARYTLESVEQHEAAPAGWMLVPVKITDAMIESALEHHYGKRRVRQSGGAAGVVMTVNDHDWSGIDAMRRFWKGALAAAPQPAAQPEPPTQPAPSAPLEGTGNGAVATVVNVGPGESDMEVELLAPLAHGTMLYTSAPRTEVAGAVPYGWKLVPVKPTHSMVDAAHSKTSMHFQWADVLDAWGAMLAIAPQPPSADAAAAPADERAAFEAWWMRDVPESYRGLACVRGSDGKYTAEKCEGAWEVWQAARAAASQPAAGSHEWDNVGERCIKCGDKDWMADPVCRGAKPAAAAGQEASIPDPTDDILCQCGWEKWNSDGGYVDRGIATSRYRSVAAFVLENTTAPPAQIVTRQGLMDEHWYDLASRHANAEWNGDGYLASVKALCDDYRALLQGAKP